MSVYHLSSVIMPNESKLTKPLLELPEHFLFNYKYHRTHWYQIPLQSYHLHHSSCASWWKRYYYQNACMTCWPKKKNTTHSSHNQHSAWKMQRREQKKNPIQICLLTKNIYLQFFLLFHWKGNLISSKSQLSRIYTPNSMCGLCWPYCIEKGNRKRFIFYSKYLHYLT